MRDIPVIDLEPLLRGGEQGLARVAGEIGQAADGLVSSMSSITAFGRA